MMVARRYETYGPGLIARGYDITPLHGKRPKLEAWQKRPQEVLEFTKYGKSNIGVLCGGESNIVAVDVDVYSENVSQLVQKAVIYELGFAPQRIGQAPKTLFVFRCTEPMKKTKTAVFEIDNKECAVEILAEGQQFVASGIHPDTKKKYSWVDDSIVDVSVDGLTKVTPSQLHQFIASMNSLLATYGEKKGRKTNGEAATQLDWFATNELEGKKKEIDIALAHIDNNDWHYDDWVQMAHAIKGALADDGLDLWHRWSKRSQKYDDAETDRVWDSIKDVKSVGAGTIFYLAKEYDFDIGTFRRESEQITTPQQPSAIPFIPWNDITGGDGADDFVENVLGTGQMSVLYGESNTGKTFFVLDLCIHVAFGWDWNGNECDKGGVIYAALEGAHGIRNRIAAFKHYAKERINDETPDFEAITTNIDLLSEDGDTKTLIDAVNERQKGFKSPLRLIVIDTLARALSGGNENSSEDMGRLVIHADAIRKETGAHVCFVHHSGKDQAKGARGHSSLRAATDTEIEVIRNQDENISAAKVTKQREFEGGQQWYFKLEYVELGTNRRMKSFGSCVVTPADTDEVSNIMQPKIKFTDNQALVVSTLKRLIDEHGIQREGYDRRSIAIEQLYDELDGRFNEKRFINNQTIMRVLNSQKLKNTITVFEKTVWLVERASQSTSH